MIGRNRLTLRRWWLNGKFPRPVKLNGTTLVWHFKVVYDWINQNIKMPETETLNSHSRPTPKLCQQGFSDKGLS
ncbi:MAG: hypothetical protein Q8R79_02915 [Legionellaceae bacterium]|nr:hypothetical protein [Legionellaceae bacterium]